MDRALKDGTSGVCMLHHHPPSIGQGWEKTDSFVAIFPYVIISPVCPLL